jgi:LAO/AO transport system kinase
MANRGALGGLSEATLQAALLMDAAGKDDVFLETVGVGQAEVDIIDHADTVVLVLIPGSGDSVQALKAGVMEIPDIIVVNKSDHPLTDTMIREIRGVLSLAPQHGWRVPIVKTEAARGQGVDELIEQMEAHRAHLEAEGMLAERRRRNLRNEILAICTHRMRRRLEEALEEDPEFARLLDEVAERETDPASGRHHAARARRRRRGRAADRRVAVRSRPPSPRSSRRSTARGGRSRSSTSSGTSRGPRPRCG